MGKTYIFGHKNPDTDTICSSIVKEKLNKKMGQSNCKAVRLGNINKETEFILNYLDIEAPELLESVEDGANVILVDHNNPKESLVKELKEQNLKFDRIKKAYLNGTFTLEEYEEERKSVEDTISNLEFKIKDCDVCDELRFTPEDIMIKRDKEYQSEFQI